ncbi:MAG: MATE family efflux transporter [Solobacterium sp.]|nr:MATE family efflux transporter [Solobacterium sp.]
MRENTNLSHKEKLQIVYRLSMPAILAQISEIIMQYIDAAMVGILGASATASIGLVSSSTWLFGGLLSATAAGFSVQIAHAVGAGDTKRAKGIFKKSILTSVLFSCLIMCLGIVVSFYLPRWLHAEESLWQNATYYFLFFSLFIPFRMLSTLSMSSLQASGNMKVPSLYLTLMCFLDVIFNYFLIFPSRTISLWGYSFSIYGANLGVLGAQLGTSLSVVAAGGLAFLYAIRKSDILNIKDVKESWLADKQIIKEALRIGGPMALQHSGHSLAQVVSTRIVAPLGTIAIAANSFAVTAESLCYMPGFGISSAATTLVGQSLGAQNKSLAKSFAWLCTALGMLVMSIGGIIMYFFSPYVFAFLTPVKEVQVLGVEVLRIELYIEALFAASIVATGALRGAGDTFVPGLINLFSMWVVRLISAYFLSQILGLKGVWIAMALDNSFAGIMILIRLKSEKWLHLTIQS